MVLGKLREVKLALNINKYQFERKQVKYLGFIIKVGVGLRMDPEKIKAIQEWEAPKTKKGVHAFLGFANYYRAFIDKFATTVAPLTALTGKHPFLWIPEAQKAFKSLKKSFISAPILAQFDPEKETRLEADSSGYTAGGALLQKGISDGIWRPVAYYSKKHTPAGSNYEIHNKELLVIMRYLEAWDTELRSVSKGFDIITDHKNIEYFTKK